MSYRSTAGPRLIAGFLALTIAASFDGGAALASGHGEKELVAFALGGPRHGIYLLDTTDGDVERLTRRDDTAPTWSPDGSMLAFRRWKEEPRRYDLVVARPDGSEPRRVGTDLAGPWGREFTWSPDASMIAYASMPETGVHEVVVVDLAGETRVVIEDARQPAWSPDGFRIAYAADHPDHPDCGTEIFTADPDGTNVEQITDDAFAEDEEPAWSPDGETIAFVSSRDHDHSHDPADCYDAYGFNTSEEIYSVPAGGGEASRLTQTYTYKRNPVWRPDGSRIAFLAQCSIDVCYDDSPKTDVFVIAADGGKERNLTRTVRRWESSPAWSPDGSTVGYSSSRGRDYRIEVVDLRTRDRSLLIDGRGREMDPHWRPS